MKIHLCGALSGVLLLVGFSPLRAEAGTIEAINHTRWAINHFSVNGQSGIDAIGPFQGGGGGCCYGAPAVWQPGIMVRVDWERGEASTGGFPGFANYEKYKAWAKKMSANNRRFSKVLSVPDYTGQETCGITVHFLPCDDVRVTTSCFTYGSPSYPVKLPLEMKEPRVCPR